MREGKSGRWKGKREERRDTGQEGRKKGEGEKRKGKRGKDRREKLQKTVSEIS